MIGSQTVHPNIQLTDISSQFINAAGKLHIGELVKDEQFTLFDAVAALEIGDSKMDSGCAEVRSRLPEDFEPGNNVSAAEVIWLIDQLMRREAAWHLGYPISQTIFTSIHIDRLLWPDPKQLADANLIRGPENTTKDVLRDDILRAYLLGLVKCCDAVHTMITGQHYYEEEDFASQCFNRELLHQFAAIDIVHLLKKARKKAAALPIPEHLRNALLSRLELRILLLEMFQMHTTVQALDQAQLARGIKLLSEQSETLSFGQPLPSAFSLRIQYRLASTVPPRPMIITDERQSSLFWTQLLMDSSTVFQTLQATSAEDAFQSVWSFISQKPQPAIYVRSLIQSFLNVDHLVFGTITPKDLILHDIRYLVLPASRILDTANEKVESPVDKRYKIASVVNQFVTRYEQSFLNIYRSYALNRCRVRRTLCHAATDWDNIQAEAETIDEELAILLAEQPIPFPPGQEKTYSYSFSSWVYHHKLVQIRLIVQMGFELQVYAPHEYAGMYWYLSHICGTHTGHLERISHFLTNSTTKSATRLSQIQIEQERQTTLRRLYRIFACLTATEALAKSLYLLYTVLQRCDKLTKATNAYAAEELRYEIRMKPFMRLSLPEPLSFPEWQNFVEGQDQSSEALLDQAVKLSSSAKKAWEEVLKGSWNCFDMEEGICVNNHTSEANGSGVELIAEREWKLEVKNCMKSSIATSVAIHHLSKFLQQKTESSSFNSLKVRIPLPGERDCWHSWWAVPAIST